MSYYVVYLLLHLSILLDMSYCVFHTLLYCVVTSSIIFHSILLYYIVLNYYVLFLCLFNMLCTSLLCYLNTDMCFYIFC